MRKLYKVRINKAGHDFIIRGKKVRSPVVFRNISEEELKLIRTQVRRAAIDCIVELEK